MKEENNRPEELEFLIKRIILIDSVEEIKKEINSNSEYFEGFDYFIKKIINSTGIERARYYLNRLLKAVSVRKTNSVNDINLNRWTDYENVITDSLWNFEKRDKSGSHLGWYWGNFVPQIPRQLMLRYTKKGDWVLDPFLGSGTTLIECKMISRNGFGIELNNDILAKAIDRINLQKTKEHSIIMTLNADSTKIDYTSLIKDEDFSGFQLAILHPPYHDIIKFSENKDDLSNVNSTEDFLGSMRLIIRNLKPALRKDGFMAIVIGDKYSAGKLEPLGFRTMSAAMEEGFALKSIVVKNFDVTKGKRTQEQLWRFRALQGGFYVFKHEYIFIFQNSKGKDRKKSHSLPL
ncbi:MAG: TRM11 family SAM-dependent methyltransferase [Thermoplasmataceae archaeon]